MAGDVIGMSSNRIGNVGVYMVNLLESNRESNRECLWVRLGWKQSLKPHRNPSKESVADTSRGHQSLVTRD